MGQLLLRGDRLLAELQRLPQGVDVRERGQLLELSLEGVVLVAEAGQRPRQLLRLPRSQTERFPPLPDSLARDGRDPERLGLVERQVRP